MVVNRPLRTEEVTDIFVFEFDPGAVSNLWAADAQRIQKRSSCALRVFELNHRRWWRGLEICPVLSGLEGICTCRGRITFRWATGKGIPKVSKSCWSVTPMRIGTRDECAAIILSLRMFRSVLYLLPVYRLYTTKHTTMSPFCILNPTNL